MFWLLKRYGGLTVAIEAGLNLVPERLRAWAAVLEREKQNQAAERLRRDADILEGKAPGDKVAAAQDAQRILTTDSIIQREMPSAEMDPVGSSTRFPASVRSDGGLSAELKSIFDAARSSKPEDRKITVQKLLALLERDKRGFLEAIAGGKFDDDQYSGVISILLDVLERSDDGSQKVVVEVIGSMTSQWLWQSGPEDQGRAQWYLNQLIRPKLEGFLYKGAPEVRSAAARSLTAIGDGASLEALVELVRYGRLDSNDPLRATLRDIFVKILVDERQLRILAEYHTIGSKSDRSLDSTRYSMQSCLRQLIDGKPYEELGGALRSASTGLHGPYIPSAIEQLSVLGDKEIVPDLIKVLLNPDGNVRRAAVEALARLPDQSALYPLLAYFRGEQRESIHSQVIRRTLSSEEKSGVITAIGAIAAATKDQAGQKWANEQATGFLLKLINDPDPSIRESAAKAMSTRILWNGHSKAVDGAELRKMALDSHERAELRCSAIFGWAALVNKEAVPDLIRLLGKEQPDEIWDAALRALAKLPEFDLPNEIRPDLAGIIAGLAKQPDGKEILTQILADRKVDEDIRVSILQTLMRLRANDAAELHKLALDPQEVVRLRCSAIHGSADLGNKEAVPDLIKLLGKEQPDGIREAAVSALAQLGDEGAGPRVLEIALDAKERTPLRCAAIHALRDLHYKDNVPYRITLLRKDQPAEIREAAVLAWGQLADAREIALDSQEGVRLRAVAIGVLSDRGGTEAIPDLRKLLVKDEPYEIWEAVTNALVNLHDERTLEPLIDIYKYLADRPSWDDHAALIAYGVIGAISAIADDTGSQQATDGLNRTLDSLLANLPSLSPGSSSYSLAIYSIGTLAAAGVSKATEYLMELKKTVVWLYPDLSGMLLQVFERHPEDVWDALQKMPDHPLLRSDYQSSDPKTDELYLRIYAFKKGLSGDAIDEIVRLLYTAYGDKQKQAQAFALAKRLIEYSTLPADKLNEILKDKVEEVKRCAMAVSVYSAVRDNCDSLKNKLLDKVDLRDGRSKVQMRASQRLEKCKEDLENAQVDLFAIQSTLAARDPSWYATNWPEFEKLLQFTERDNKKLAKDAKKIFGEMYSAETGITGADRAFAEGFIEELVVNPYEMIKAFYKSPINTTTQMYKGLQDMHDHPEKVIWGLWNEFKETLEDPSTYTEKMAELSGRLSAMLVGAFIQEGVSLAAVKTFQLGLKALGTANKTARLARLTGKAGRGTAEAEKLLMRQLPSEAKTVEELGETWTEYVARHRQGQLGGLDFNELTKLTEDYKKAIIKLQETTEKVQIRIRETQEARTGSRSIQTPTGLEQPINSYDRVIQAFESKYPGRGSELAKVCLDVHGSESIEILDGLIKGGISLDEADQVVRLADSLGIKKDINSLIKSDMLENPNMIKSFIENDITGELDGLAVRKLHSELDKDAMGKLLNRKLDQRLSFKEFQDAFNQKFPKDLDKKIDIKHYKKRYQNVDPSSSRSERLKPYMNGISGKLQEFRVANRYANQGYNVRLGGKGDIVVSKNGKTAVIQLKALTISDEAHVADELLEAVNQIEGKAIDQRTGKAREMPDPEDTRVVEIQLIEDPLKLNDVTKGGTKPALYMADRDTIREFLRNTLKDKVNSVDKINFINGKGTYEFTITKRKVLEFNEKGHPIFDKHGNPIYKLEPVLDKDGLPLLTLTEELPKAEPALVKALQPGDSRVKEITDKGIASLAAVDQARAGNARILLDGGRSLPMQAKPRTAPIKLGGKPLEPLTSDFIRSRGLEPKYHIQIGDRNIYLSAPFEVRGRSAFIAYIQGPDGAVELRTFYRSTSASGFRSASHRVENDTWIGKGSEIHGGEDTTNLAAELNRELNLLSDNSEKVSLTEHDADSAFYGTAEAYPDSPMGRAGTPETFAKSLDSVVELAKPVTPKDQILDARGDIHIKPEAFQFKDPQMKPDFSRPPTEHYTYNHPLYGEIEAFHFTSRDGKFNFVICKDKNGHGWVNNVEVVASEINGFGVKKIPVDAGDLTTPPFEYDIQIPIGYMGNHVKDAAGQVTHYRDASSYVHPLLDSAFGSEWRIAIGL